MSQSVRAILRRMSFDKHKAMQRLKLLIEKEQKREQKVDRGLL